MTTYWPRANHKIHDQFFSCINNFRAYKHPIKFYFQIGIHLTEKKLIWIGSPSVPLTAFTLWAMIWIKFCKSVFAKHVQIRSTILCDCGRLLGGGGQCFSMSDQSLFICEKKLSRVLQFWILMLAAPWSRVSRFVSLMQACCRWWATGTQLYEACV